MAAFQKVYLSNIATAWPDERQKALIPVPMNDQTVFADMKLSKVTKKDRGKLLEALKDRRQLLRTANMAGDEIHVASLACLVVDRRDLLDFASQCAKCGVTIIAYHGDVRIEPQSGTVLLAEASDQLMKDRTGGATEKSRAAAAELKKQQTRDRLALVELDYKQREMTMTEIRIKAGTKRGRKIAPMAPSTLLKAFGNRVKAQKAHEAELFRLARIAEAKAQKAAAKKEKAK